MDPPNLMDQLVTGADLRRLFSWPPTDDKQHQQSSVLYSVNPRKTIDGSWPTWLCSPRLWPVEYESAPYNDSFVAKMFAAQGNTREIMKLWGQNMYNNYYYEGDDVSRILSAINEIVISGKRMSTQYLAVNRFQSFNNEVDFVRYGLIAVGHTQDQFDSKIAQFYENCQQNELEAEWVRSVKKYFNLSYPSALEIFMYTSFSMCMIPCTFTKKDIRKYRNALRREAVCDIDLPDRSMFFMEQYKLEDSAQVLALIRQICDWMKINVSFEQTAKIIVDSVFSYWSPSDYATVTAAQMQYVCLVAMLISNANTITSVLANSKNKTPPFVVYNILIRATKLLCKIKHTRQITDETFDEVAELTNRKYFLVMYSTIHHKKYLQPPRDVSDTFALSNEIANAKLLCAQALRTAPQTRPADGAADSPCKQCLHDSR